LLGKGKLAGWERKIVREKVRIEVEGRDLGKSRGRR
jgi:hypothetical protein